MPKDKRPKNNPLTNRYDREFVEFACPLCKRSVIVCLPEEPIPVCEFCNVEMAFKEVLTEGKY